MPRVSLPPSRSPSPVEARPVTHSPRHDGELARLINEAFKGNQANLLGLSLKEPAEPRRVPRAKGLDIDRPNAIRRDNSGRKRQHRSAGTSPDASPGSQSKDWLSNMLVPLKADKACVTSRPSMGERTISWKKMDPASLLEDHGADKKP